MKYNKVTLIIEKIEKDPGILDFIIRDVPIWMIIRQKIIQQIIDTLNKNLEPEKNFSKIKMVLFFCRNQIKSPFLRFKKNKIVFIANSLKKENNGFKNIFVEPLAKINKGDSYILYEGSKTIQKSPLKNERPLHSIDLTSQLYLNFFVLTKKEIEEILKLKKYLDYRLTEYGFNYGNININDITKVIKTFFIKVSKYQKLFKKIKPSIIIVESLCYSRYYFSICAKSLKIPIAEIQHGFIDNNNHAYNIGNKLSEHPSLKLLFPDYLLSFGNYWNSFYNVPIREHFNLGFLNIEYEKNKYYSCSITPSILIISSSINPKEIIEYTLKINAIAKQKKTKIIFRPRPNEFFDYENKFSALLEDENIKIDTSQNIYQTFRNCNTVIGDYSTVLFEALYFVKSIYMLKTKTSEIYCSNNIFPIVNLENIHNVFSTNFQNFDTIKNQIWADGVENNFKLFLKKIKKNT